jgi:sulfoxide reductase heme-binding subunit YedZ
MKQATARRSRIQFPWRDRRGRFSRLKAITLTLLLIPGLWLAWEQVTGDVGPLPLVFLIYHSGVWATWLLLLSLAVTPARHLLGWGQLITVRRMIGVAGLGYTVAHIVIYVALDRFDWGYIANEMSTRVTLMVATASTAGLVALGATSFDAAIRGLGTDRWNQLHNVTYPAIGLAVIHWDLSPGSDFGAPFVATAIFVWLMGWRLLHRHARGRDPIALAGLAAAAAAVTFVFQIVWLLGWKRYPPSETIGYAFNLVIGLDATWCILLLGLAVSALVALFGTDAAGRRRLGRNRASSEPNRAPACADHHPTISISANQ